MSTFSKGDRVEYHATDPDTNTPELEGYVGTVAELDSVGGVEVDWDDRAARNIRRGGFLPRNLRKVEPEWVVGQQVSGTDYERLPVGSRATWTYRSDSKPVPSVKVGDDSWCEGEGADAAIRSNREMHLPRTITHLPEHAEPEDATAAYVEPEPLKEDQHVLVWAKVVRESDDSVYVSVGSEDLDWRQAWVGADAIVRPDAGSLPPWVKPARCTSLFMVNRIKLRQCGRPDDGHEMHSAGSVSWRDATAYGTVEISS